MSKKELLIVGAGVTGSLTAALVHRVRPDLAVSVWDKARGAGGRMSTHRCPSRPSLHVDMGAQYITHFRVPGTSCDAGCSSGALEFQKLKEDTFRELISSGTLVSFSGVIEGVREELKAEARGNYVAPNGLSSVSKFYLNQSEADVCFQQQLSKVVIGEPGEKIDCITANGSKIRCDSLVLTMPVPQILSLDGNLVSFFPSGVKSNLENVEYSSRYALGLFYEGKPAPVSPPSISWSAKYIDSPTVRYVSWDTTKRGCSPLTGGEALLVHTSVPFGIANLDLDKAAVQSLILDSLHEVLPGLPSYFHSHIIRWKYSQVYRPYQGCPGYVVLSEDPLVVATGDGFSGSKFEDCLWSAYVTTKVI